jgi:hypothetical protein
MAKPSPKRFPLRPVWPKRSARSPNANASGNWASTCWMSTNRSANCGQWMRPRRRPRKKDGRNDPEGNRARSKPTTGRDLSGSAQDGALRSGSHRDSGAISHAPRRGKRAQQTPAIPAASRQPAHPCLLLRPTGCLPAVALQARTHSGGEGRSIAALLLVPALPSWPVPRRRRTGHQRHGVLSGRAPHAGDGGPGGAPSTTGASR